MEAGQLEFSWDASYRFKVAEFFSITVAPTRMHIDTCQTIIIWE